MFNREGANVGPGPIVHAAVCVGHVCRHRCTDRTLTRRSSAIAALAEPRANRSAAWNRNPRGTAAVRRSARPLGDTACPRWHRS